MLSEPSSAYWQRAKWVEAFLVLFAAPFLLFPAQFPLLTLLALLLLACAWIAPLILARTPLIPPTPYNAALLMLCLALCAGILVSADPDLTLGKATGLILGLAVWRYMVLAVRNQLAVQWALAAFLLVGVSFITVGLLNADWLLKSTSRVPLLGPLLAQMPSRAFLGTPDLGIHPNQIAGTIMLVLPLLFSLLTGVSRGHRQLNWLLAAVTLFCTLALVLTQSRSGWLGLLAGTLLMLLLWAVILGPSRKRTFLRLSLLIAVGFVLLIVVVVGPQRLQQLWLEPPQETAVGSLTTLNFRQDLWPWALRAIGDFPFTGIGLGSFRRAGARLYPIPVDPNLDFAHAHNVFLQVALDLGLAGLIAYCALLLLCAVVGWSIARASARFRSYSIGLLGSLAAFHVFGLADTLALGSKPAVLFWAVLALLAAMIRLR